MRDKAKNAFTRLQHVLEYLNSSAASLTSNRKMIGSVTELCSNDGQTSMRSFLSSNTLASLA